MFANTYEHSLCAKHKQTPARRFFLHFFFLSFFLSPFPSDFSNDIGEVPYRANQQNKTEKEKRFISSLSSSLLLYKFHINTMNENNIPMSNKNMLWGVGVILEELFKCAMNRKFSIPLHIISKSMRRTCLRKREKTEGDWGKKKPRDRREKMQ